MAFTQWIRFEKHAGWSEQSSYSNIRDASTKGLSAWHDLQYYDTNESDLRCRTILGSTQVTFCHWDSHPQNQPVLLTQLNTPNTHGSYETNTVVSKERGSVDFAELLLKKVEFASKMNK